MTILYKSIIQDLGIFYIFDIGKFKLRSLMDTLAWKVSHIFHTVVHIPGKIEMAELNELPVLMGDKLKNQADLYVNNSFRWLKLEDQLISLSIDFLIGLKWGNLKQTIDNQETSSLSIKLVLFISAYFKSWD